MAADDLAGLLAYSTTYEEDNGTFKPTGGDKIDLCRLILPQGGLIEFAWPLASVYFYFEPAEGRDVWAWNDRADVGDLDKAWHPYMLRAPDRFPWGWGQAFTPNIVALQLAGPVMLEDVVYKETGE